MCSGNPVIFDIQKTWLSGATFDEVRAAGIALPRAYEQSMMERLRSPEHVRIMQVFVGFQDIHNGVNPTNIFYPPASCAC